MDIIQGILEELKIKEDYLLKIRVSTGKYDLGLHEKALRSSVLITELRAELSDAINRYSSMGHIRMLDELPSKSGTPSK